MTPPPELIEAQLIDKLCRRYGALPSQVLAEDVEVIRIMQLADMATEGAT